MAIQKSIQFTGIQRALPQSLMPDGACCEQINCRRKKGALRPVGTKKTHKSWNLSAYDKVWTHDIENGITPGEPNYIGYKKDIGLLFLIWDNEGTLTHTEITRDETPGKDISVVFLKRTMIVTSDAGVEIFLFVTDSVTEVKSYIQTADLPVPDITLSQRGLHVVNSSDPDTSVSAHSAEAVLGNYFAALNEQSQTNGAIFGSIMYITVYRLFDGSYIVPSVPRYFQASNSGKIYQRNPNGGTQSDSLWWFNFSTKSLYVTINKSDYGSISEEMKELIESICVFSTKATTLHNINEETLTDQKLLQWFTSGTNNRDFQYMFPINSEFITLAKSASWYKIHEINFEDIVGSASGLSTYDLDLKGFYQDYATRETLTTDQFTHHKLAARESYVYNDRLHLLNIKTSLGSPYVLWPTIASSGTYQGIISVFIKTSLGKAIVNNSVDIPYYDASFIIPEILAYNDARAYKIQVSVTISGVTYKLLEESLTKNVSMNFSFWHKTIFNADPGSTTANYKQQQILISTIVSNYPSITTPSEIGLPFDTNRLQVSEIQNPLIFPAKNSYQIGTGDGLAMCAASEPLSTGQFGQFPLQVFTSKGIWALEIGTGDVLYTNILPVNGEVINNRNNVVSLSQGVCYTTETGLFVVNGREVIELSDNIENAFDTFALTESDDVQTLITDSKFVPSLSNALSDISFIDYLTGSSVGYDHLNKELFVTNSSKGYSYVYSFENQSWYKISTSYRLLINLYPKLLAVNSGNIVSISEELTTNPVDCLIITASQSLETPDAYKKIERAILRGLTHSSIDFKCGFYVFGSDDTVTWKLLIGNQRFGLGIKDYLIQRTHGSAKYYAFVFAGRISTSSEIKQIELIFNLKWNNRLR